MSVASLYWLYAAVAFVGGVRVWYSELRAVALERIERDAERQTILACPWCEEPGITTDLFRYRCSSHGGIRAFRRIRWHFVLVGALLWWGYDAMRFALRRADDDARRLADQRAVDRFLKQEMGI